MNRQELEKRFSNGTTLRLPLWGLKEAAVLIPLSERNGELHVLLTKRTDDLETHRGEISFPGGQREKGDRSSWETAAREAFEEIGVKREDLSPLGTLDDSVTITGFRITPHVAFLPSDFEPTPNPTEVARAFWVPLDELFRQAAGFRFMIPVQGVKEVLSVFRWDGELIWGATARLIRELLKALTPPQELSGPEKLVIQLRRFAARLVKGSRFIISTHINPDADGLGCQLALAGVLRRMGKEVQMVNSDPISKQFQFMLPKDPPAVAGKSEMELHRWADTMVILDTGEYRRLGRMAEVARKMDGKRLVLDHHLSGDIEHPEDVFIAESTFSSCSELVYRLLLELGCRLEPGEATSLYAGMMFDTRGFRFIQDRSDPLAIAAALVDAGADSGRVQEQLFASQSPAAVKASAMILSAMNYEHDGRMVWTLIPENISQLTGADREEVGDVIAQMISVDGVVVAATIREEPSGKIKISLRSKIGYPLSSVTDALGGGGHQNACGAVVAYSPKVAIEKVVDLVGKVIARGKQV